MPGTMLGRHPDRTPALALTLELVRTAARPHP